MQSFPTDTTCARTELAEILAEVRHFSVCIFLIDTLEKTICQCKKDLN